MMRRSWSEVVLSSARGFERGWPGGAIFVDFHAVPALSHNPENQPGAINSAITKSNRKVTQTHTTRGTLQIKLVVGVRITSS